MNESEKIKKENAKLRLIIARLQNEKTFLQKKGMVKKAEKGKIMSRAPFGYKINLGRLTPSEDYKRVEEIFLEFREKEISLNKLSKKYGFSLNGLKKILTNFTYLGKIKFDGQIHSGSHRPILSSTLFNQVQDKLERLGIKKQF